MKKINLILLAVLSSFFSVLAEDNRTNGNSCFENDPVQELPWLKAMVERFTQNEEFSSRIIEIRQCTYGDGEIGFLIDPCLRGCPNPGYEFYSCDGVQLCFSGEISGENDCKDLRIDTENAKLILEIHNGKIGPFICEFENPLTDLLWLKTMVEDFIQYAGSRVVEIHQCTYGSGEIGFLIDRCRWCPDSETQFYSCDGVPLCLIGGFSGSDFCKERGIISESKRLIWKIEKGIASIPSVETLSSVHLYSEKDSKKIKIEAQDDVVEYVEIISGEGKKVFSSVYPGLNNVLIDLANCKAGFLVVRVVLKSSEVRKKIIL